MFVEASKPPIRYSVEVEPNHRILDVRVSISKLCQIPPRRLLITEVYNHCIILNKPPMASARKLRNDDDYFAFEIPDFGQIPRPALPPFEIGQKFDVENRRNRWETAELVEFKWGAPDRFRSWKSKQSGRRTGGGYNTYRNRNIQKRKESSPPNYEEAVAQTKNIVSESKKSPKSENAKDQSKKNKRKIRRRL